MIISRLRSVLPLTIHLVASPQYSEVATVSDVCYSPPHGRPISAAVGVFSSASPTGRDHSSPGHHPSPAARRSPGRQTPPHHPAAHSAADTIGRANQRPRHCRRAATGGAGRGGAGRGERGGRDSPFGRHRSVMRKRVLKCGGGGGSVASMVTTSSTCLKRD